MLGFLRGRSGEFRVGYQLAARLGNWSARRAKDGHFALDAEAVEVNSYWIERGPIVAHLWVGVHRWVFEVESPANSSGRIQARLIRK